MMMNSMIDEALSLVEVVENIEDVSTRVMVLAENLIIVRCTGLNSNAV